MRCCHLGHDNIEGRHFNWKEVEEQLDHLDWVSDRIIGDEGKEKERQRVTKHRSGSRGSQNRINVSRDNENPTMTIHLLSPTCHLSTVTLTPYNFSNLIISNTEKQEEKKKLPLPSPSCTWEGRTSKQLFLFPFSDVSSHSALRYRFDVLDLLPNITHSSLLFPSHLVLLQVTFKLSGEM